LLYRYTRTSDRIIAMMRGYTPYGQALPLGIYT